MGIVFESFYTDVLVFVVFILVSFIYYMNCNFDYWKKRGVHYLKPEPFFGNVRKLTLLQKNLGESLQELYNKLEGHKYGGIFQTRTPVLLLRDPDIIKTFMVKDFAHFQDRGLNVDPINDPLSQHLFNLGGPQWRALRTKLTPTFTSGKMKMMFGIMEECAEQLKEYLSEPAKREEEIELKEVLAKFTTDIIGSAAFGLQFNSMTDPNSEFRQMGRKIFEGGLVKSIKRLILFVKPSLAARLRVSLVDKDVTKFFLGAVKETVDYRVKNNVQRNDFLQLLIQLRNKGKVDDDQQPEGDHDKEMRTHRHDDDLHFTDTLLASQVFIFFLAGFETSSTTMSFALYELAVNPDIQARLRDEVDATLKECGGKITYEAIQKMEYMDKVVSETLRKYPPVANLIRECTIPYTIPDSNIKLEKGIRVLIPAFAIQRDPKYYPDPEKFDPERFTEENKAKRPHYTYLPFGEGPRICIGMRFGLLQSKIGLFTLLANYEFSVSEGTEMPLKFNPKAIVTSSMTGTILKITSRHQQS